MNWWWDPYIKYVEKRKTGAVIYDIDVDPPKTIPESHHKTIIHRFLCTAAYR